MELIDSHAHITSKELLNYLEDLLVRAQRANVKKIVNVCTDKLSLERGILLKDKYNWIYNAASTTPHDVEKEGDKYFSFFSDNAKARNLVAIGETGLDYYYKHSSVEMQKKFLEKYFKLALETNLPVILHCRDAFEDLFAIAKNSYPSEKVVLHCFTGTKKDAKEALNRGWYISFSGIITFKKSTDLLDIVKYVPLDKILLETDTPFLAPESKRGQLNEPGNLMEIADKVADAKKCLIEEVALATSSNAKNFFSLPNA